MCGHRRERDWQAQCGSPVPVGRLCVRLQQPTSKVKSGACKGRDPHRSRGNPRSSCFRLPWPSISKLTEQTYPVIRRAWREHAFLVEEPSVARKVRPILRGMLRQNPTRMKTYSGLDSSISYQEPESRPGFRDAAPLRGHKEGGLRFSSLQPRSLAKDARSLGMFAFTRVDADTDIRMSRTQNGDR